MRIKRLSCHHREAYRGDDNREMNARVGENDYMMEKVTFQTSSKSLTARSNYAIRPVNARRKRPCPTNLKRSNYAENYCEKPLTDQHLQAWKYAMIHGNSRCNPHPLQNFLVWRLPRWFIPLVEDSLNTTAEQNLEKLLTRHPVVSTYQSDYTGTQQRHEQSVAALVTGMAKQASGEKKAASIMKTSYTGPRQTVNLKENTTRYGCDEGFVRAARGIVPTLTNAQSPLATNYQTCYKREFASKRKGNVDSVNSRLRLPKIDARVQPQLTQQGHE